MIPLPLLALVLPLSVAQAQDCDLETLETEMAEASPRALGELFTRLAFCDAETTQRMAPEYFPRVLSGQTGVDAAAAVVGAGAGDIVREWISGLISDERASTLAGLGESCEAQPALVGFFTESHAQLGERFWRDRWHRALADCRAPEIQELLRLAFQEESVQKDSSRFGSILEVFCTNARGAAIPWLKALLFTTYEENQLHIISAFANAAGVGSLEGTDPDAAKAAVTAIVEVAPQVPASVVEQARITLESLGAPQEADELAAVRYADRQQADGRFMWGAVAVETATCKKGDTRLGVHHAQVFETGHHWPDQMQPAVDASVMAGWEMNLGQKCKGTSRHEVIVSSAPFQAEEQWISWRDEQLREIRKRPHDKISESEEPAPFLN